MSVTMKQYNGMKYRFDMCVVYSMYVHVFVHVQQSCAAPASFIKLNFPFGLEPLFMRTTVQPFSFGIKSNMGCRTALHSVILITSE